MNKKRVEHVRQLVNNCVEKDSPKKIREALECAIALNPLGVVVDGRENVLHRLHALLNPVNRVRGAANRPPTKGSAAPRPSSARRASVGGTSAGSEQSRASPAHEKSPAYRAS